MRIKKDYTVKQILKRSAKTYKNLCEIKERLARENFPLEKSRELRNALDETVVKTNISETEYITRTNGRKNPYYDSIFDIISEIYELIKSQR